MRHHLKSNIILFLSFVADVATVFAAFFCTTKLCGLMNISAELDYINLAVFEASMIFFFFMLDLYASKEGNRESTIISVMISSLASVVVLAIVSSLLLPIKYTPVFFFVLLACCAVFAGVWRMCFSFLLARFREKEKILILESSCVPSRLARKIKYSCNNISEAWYYIIDESKPEEVEHVINEVVPGYDRVFISKNLSENLEDRLFEECLLLGKTVNLLATPGNVSMIGGKIHQFSDTPVMEQGSIYLKKYQRFLKRSFDIVFSLCALILSSPIFLVLPILIRLDSQGPAFYLQERYTINKKRFNIYKFRTMYTDAEKDGAKFSAGDNDSRITRAGKIIRKLRLDELPQLINILNGSMSVVGPRPERPIFADEFCEKVKHYNLRYTMKAGLTGYAQIYGKYNTRVSDKILLDMIYAIKYSFWLDIKLVILTVRTMFIKESTEGVDEESERILNTPEKERERILNNNPEKGDTKYETVSDNSGI